MYGLLEIAPETERIIAQRLAAAHQGPTAFSAPLSLLDQATPL
jgi:hypothetical protein